MKTRIKGIAESALALAVMVGPATVAPAHAGSRPAQAADLAPVHVTGTPTDRLVTPRFHAMTVVTRADIRASSATNLDDLLADIPGVTVRRRGAPGMQADISIHGSNFKETRILVDGIPFQSPQAGHLNADVPIPLAAIKRIEIIKGSGAAGYRGNGTGGIVNIITRSPDAFQARAGLAAGSHASHAVQASLGIGGDRFSGLVAVHAGHAGSETRSRPTDADVRQGLYTGAATLGRTELRWGLASSRKDFGAWGFYSDVLPNAREKTRSQMAWIKARVPWRHWRVQAQAYGNRQTDHFLTLASQQRFLNRHRSHASGLGISAQRSHGHGTTRFGGKFRGEALRSNALGRHQRHSAQLWAARRQRLGHGLSLEMGLDRAIYPHGQRDWLPSVALAWQAEPRWRTHLSWARQARLPTYTELYIQTPANQGNPDLGRERSVYTEWGLSHQMARQSIETSVYQRHVSGFIDFVRLPHATAFHAENLHGLRTSGADVTWHWRPHWHWLSRVSLGYSRLHHHLDTGAAKNTTHLPWQTIRAALRMPLSRHFHGTLNVQRPSYRNQPDATLVGMRLTWQYRHLEWFLDGRNLLDRRIIEAGFAPIPGRWITIGLSARF